MNAADSLQLVNQAFSRSDNKLGLDLLRKYCVANTKDTEQLYRLAVIEEQIGVEENALTAYFQCINSAKSFMRAYLYVGYLFQQKGQLEKALALYSLGNDQDARLSFLHYDENMSYETRLRSHTANIALRTHFTNLHERTVDKGSKSSKIAGAVWPQTHNTEVNYLFEQQQPHLFYIPELSAKAVYDSNSFDWCKSVEDNFSDLTDEFTDLLALIYSEGAPYIDGSFKDKGFKLLAGSANWSALNLYKNGVANNSLLQLIPKTAKILEKLPLYNLDNNPFEVFFSLLKAGQHITPHYGQSNHTLTVHLPIIVPKGGYLTVAGQKIPWQKGKLIVFDDSFEHEAINPSDEDRVVLIFSIWHPDLSNAEKQDVLASFQTRSDWLASRNQHLDCDSS
jgi:hypothetical protein